MDATRQRAEAKARLEEGHWWYRGRRLVLEGAAERLDLPPSAAILDAGCGSGRNMPLLARHGRVSGFDPDPHAVELARARGAGTVALGRLESIPFGDESFDLTTCLDVLEHVEDDHAALRELLRVTRPGAAALVSVPAHPALWSRHDVAAGHRRRYSARELRARLAAAGWELRALTHFHAAALGPAALLRLGGRLRRGAEPRSDLRVRVPVGEGALVWPSRVERRLLAGGRSIPFGLSLLATLRKPPA